MWDLLFTVQLSFSSISRNSDGLFFFGQGALASPIMVHHDFCWTWNWRRDATWAPVDWLCSGVTTTQGQTYIRIITLTSLRFPIKQPICRKRYWSYWRFCRRFRGWMGLPSFDVPECHEVLFVAWNRSDLDNLCQNFFVEGSHVEVWIGGSTSQETKEMVV